VWPKKFFILNDFLDFEICRFRQPEFIKKSDFLGCKRLGKINHFDYSKSRNLKYKKSPHIQNLRLIFNMKKAFLSLVAVLVFKVCFAYFFNMCLLISNKQLDCICMYAIILSASPCPLCYEDTRVFDTTCQYHGSSKCLLL
jgi:hypothetical protein